MGITLLGKWNFAHFCNIKLGASLLSLAVIHGAPMEQKVPSQSSPPAPSCLDQD